MNNDDTMPIIYMLSVLAFKHSTDLHTHTFSFQVFPQLLCTLVTYYYYPVNFLMESTLPSHHHLIIIILIFVWHVVIKTLYTHNNTHNITSTYKRATGQQTFFKIKSTKKFYFLKRSVFFKSVQEKRDEMTYTNRHVVYI